MHTRVKLLAASSYPGIDDVITLEMKYPRIIHAEFMTHRNFSRNAASSRAIPVEKMIEAVENEPFIPYFWGKNKPGMQASEECRNYVDTNVGELSPKAAWLMAADEMCSLAEAFAEAGYHKQIVNRLIEPFQYITVIATATYENWMAFLALRDHHMAQPEMQELARQVRHEVEGCEPRKLCSDEWHLPLTTGAERGYFDQTVATHKASDIIRISAARCARVSYLKHDGSAATLEDDLALCEKLAGSRPQHLSPFEHQCRPMRPGEKQLGNLPGWRQFRHEIELK